MGGFGILLRKSHVFETLCRVNHLVIDKTGTLTNGNIEVCRVALHSSWTEEQCLALAASLEQHANHPIAKAFRTYADAAFVVKQVQNVIGSGVVGQYGTHEVKIGSAEFVLSNASQGEVNAIYLAIGGEHVATFFYQDPVRKEAKTFIDKFHDAGIRITLLTGDSEANAQTVARQMGIDNVVAQAKPEDKLAYLNKINAQDITMMVGDGINDAPTLAGAHISVAMGGGTDVAKASADMVLLGDKLDKLLEARALALKTRRIIRENLAWSLGYNVLILPLAVAGLVAPYVAVVGMSASSIIVVSNSLRLLKEQGK